MYGTSSRTGAAAVATVWLAWPSRQGVVSKGGLWGIAAMACITGLFTIGLVLVIVPAFIALFRKIKSHYEDAARITQLPEARDLEAWQREIYRELFRPGDGPESRLPQRAIGVKWLKVDPGERQLGVSLGLPDKIRPGGPMTVPISVTGLRAGETGRIMLAAVELGPPQEVVLAGLALTTRVSYGAR